MGQPSQQRNLMSVRTHIRPEHMADFEEARRLAGGVSAYALAQALVVDALKRFKALPEESRRQEVWRLLKGRLQR